MLVCVVVGGLWQTPLLVGDLPLVTSLCLPLYPNSRHGELAAIWKSGCKLRYGWTSEAPTLTHTYAPKEPIYILQLMFNKFYIQPQCASTHRHTNILTQPLLQCDYQENNESSCRGRRRWLVSPDMVIIVNDPLFLFLSPSLSPFPFTFSPYCPLPLVLPFLSFIPR